MEMNWGLKKMDRKNCCFRCCCALIQKFIQLNEIFISSIYIIFHSSVSRSTNLFMLDLQHKLDTCEVYEKIRREEMKNFCITCGGKF